jgi:hypothetical protein
MRVNFLLRLCVKYIWLHIFPYKAFVCIIHSFVRDSKKKKVCDLFLSCCFFLPSFLSLFIYLFIFFIIHFIVLIVVYTSLLRSGMIWDTQDISFYYVFPWQMLWVQECLLCLPMTDIVSTRRLTKSRITVLGRFYNVV